MAKLEVQIGADASELKSEIASAEAKIERLRKEKSIQVKLGMDSSALTKSINESKAQLASLKKSVDNTSQSFAGMKPQVANGGNALMQFSRIAQDAPYGIIGIGNNLTATAEAFGHLSKQSGGAGNALKAVASSLMGTGGILLAVSLVTTGLTLLSQSGLTIGDVFDKLTGNFDAFGESMKKIAEESKKSAAEQISSLKGMIAIAQDENQSKQRRLEIVDQIQKQYPNYFGNLSKERIMYGDLTGTVNDLTSALINKAIAEKTAGTTADSTVKLWKANGKLIASKKELEIAERKYNEAVSDPAKSQQIQFFASQVDRASDRVKDAREEVLKFNKEVQRGQDIINLASKKASGVIATPLAEPKEPKKPKKVFNIPKSTELDTNLTAEGLANTSGLIVKIAKDVQGAEGVIATSMGNINLAFDTSTVGMLEALQDFNDSASDIINNSIADTFAGLGSAIGNALASGGNVMKAAGSALLASVGTLLTNLGTMAIQVGVGLLGIKAALKTLNPAVAIGAGVALVALGAVFSSKASALGSSGGSSGSGGNSPQTGASYSTPSASNSGSGSGSFGGGTVVFEISGNSLIGVLSNALDKNKRLGGSLGIV